MQPLNLLMLSIRTIRTRAITSAIYVLSTAVVLTIVSFFLSLSEGLSAVLSNTGQEDRAIVIRQGSEVEAASRIGREVVDFVFGLDQIEVDEVGNKKISEEIVRSIDLQRNSLSERLSVPLRGVGGNYINVRREINITEGRSFAQGSYEIIVGKAVADQFPELEVGNSLQIKDTEWKVVGIFEARNGTLESEILADTQTLLGFFQSSLISSLLVTLINEDQFYDFKTALEESSGLNVEVFNEKAYYDLQAQNANSVISVVAVLVGILIALSSFFASISCVYTGVKKRIRDIACLRAIGYQSRSIVLSIVLESLLLSVIGALIGILATFVLFNGFYFSTLAGGYGFSQTTFSLELSPQIVIISILFATISSVLGSIVPAIQSAKLNISRVLS